MLRPATDDDKDVARQTHHDAFREVVIRQFGVFDPELQDAFFDDEWNAASYEIVVVEGEPAGYVQRSRST